MIKKNRKDTGHTLIELLIVMSIFAIFIGISSMNLLGSRSKTSIGTTVDVLIADIRSQQTKAMSGDTDGGSSNINHGIHFLTNSYILFKNVYSYSDPTNYIVTLDDTTIDTTFPSSEIVFQKGAGDVINFNSATNTIRLTSTSENGSQKIIVINRFGVITSVN